MTDKNLDDESDLSLRLRLHEALYKESEAWDAINTALETIAEARAEQRKAKEALRRRGQEVS